MAIDWVKNFIIPLIEVTFLIGLGGSLIFIVLRAIVKTWKKSTKFFIKYTIFRNKYPENHVKWILDCVDAGIGWYDAKKVLMINMIDQDEVNEIMWIYDKIINELNKKGGDNNGRQLKRSNRKTKSPTELPKTTGN